MAAVTRQRREERERGSGGFREVKDRGRRVTVGTEKSAAANTEVAPAS